MEELIKRLERVIATGAPDKDGMHPVSAETVLEVVKGLSELGTNLASLGTDCISRKSAIEIVEKYFKKIGLNGDICVDGLRQLQPIQPEIVRCKDCKHHWTYKCMDSMPIERCDLEQTFYDAEIDFCSLAERREVNRESN